MFGTIKNLFSYKGALREKMLAERKIAFKARADAPIHAARLFMDYLAITPKTIAETMVETRPKMVVALYYPINEELDTMPLAKALEEQDIQLALPVVVAKKSPLIFRQWNEDSEMEKGSYNIPVPTQQNPVIIPTHILVPMVAFSRAGVRLGYGGGYYDRTLAQLRADHKVCAIGYGFGAQEVDDLPAEPLDQPLDWIITEREAIQVATKHEQR